MGEPIAYKEMVTETKSMNPMMENKMSAYIGSDNRFNDIMAGKSYGASLTQEVLMKSAGTFGNRQEGMFMYTQNEQRNKDNLLKKLQNLETNFLERETERYTHELPKSELVTPEKDPAVTDKADRKGKSYQYGRKYTTYKPEEKQDKEAIKTDYTPFSKDKKDSKYSKDLGLDLRVSEYDPLSANPREKPAQAYNALEAVAYAALAQDHAYSSITGEGNAQHYLLRKGNQEVSATEGYITEVGLHYLNLTVSDGTNTQNYMIMLKEAEERDIKFSENINLELEKLLERLNKEGSINEEEVLDSLVRILSKQDSEFDIFLQEKELETTLNSVRKIKAKDNLSNIILLLEKKESKELKKITQLIIKKRKNNTRKQEERENHEHPIKGMKPVTNYSTSNYSRPFRSYLRELERKRRDFTNLVPMKSVTKFPRSIMGGVLGFTYLGENFMGIRDDLNAEEANEVEIHEAIHTPDEYETRVITKWMLEDEGTHYH